MTSKPSTVLSSLLNSASIDDHEEVLKQANAELKKNKSNQDVQKTRIVALLKLDRLGDALRALDDGGDKLAERCVLEKAYALYKTGQLEDAAKVVEGCDMKSRGIKHVAAQVAYRAEQFENARNIYMDLSAHAGTIEGEENDLRINSAAVDVQLEWQGNGENVDERRKKPVREDLEAFETAYNAACGYIARGDLGAGSVLLKRARDLCEALDELSDEEKKAEVLPIMVQQAYVFTRMGKLEEVDALQRMINISDVPEPPTRLIAQNNALATRLKSQNPFMTNVLFESGPTLSKSESLFDYQARILRKNRYTLDLHCMKYDGVARSTEKIMTQNPAPNMLPSVNGLSTLYAAAHAKCGSSKASLREILPLLEKRPSDIGLILTIIQLYVLTNNPGPAITLLESFFKRLEGSATTADQDIRFAPGLVALMVSLYRLQGRKAPTKTELGKAASYWRRRLKHSDDLLRAAGLSLLDSSKPEDLSAAGEIFASLHDQEPNDQIAIAGFIASNATRSISTVQSELSKLTSVEKMISGIDASKLEEAGIAKLSITVQKATKKRSAPAEREIFAKKKIRKSKLPRDFEEGKKMDPERWLPMRDRSSYRPKGKKGKKKALESTQGGVVKDEESLELVGGAGAVKVEKAPLGGGKAKKKKGKK